MKREEDEDEEGLETFPEEQGHPASSHDELEPSPFIP